MEQKKQYSARQVFSTIGLGLSVFIIITYLLDLLFLRFGTFLSDSYASRLLFVYACLYGIGFFFYMLVVRRLPNVENNGTSFSFGQLFKLFCIAYAISIISNLIGTLITLVLGSQTNIVSNIIDIVSNGQWLSFLIVVLVAPFVEELVFRKLIIDKTQRFGEKQAILFSALCFGLFHMNVQQFIYAFAVGLVFGYVYTKSKRIHYTMIMHSIINMIGFFISLVTASIAEPFAELQNMAGMSTQDIDGNEVQRILSAIAPNLILLLFIFACILTLVILGIVFFAKNVRKVTFCKDGIQEPATASKMFLNVGFIVFAVLCVANIVIAFLGIL